MKAELDRAEMTEFYGTLANPNESADSNTLRVLLPIALLLVALFLVYIVLQGVSLGSLVVLALIAFTIMATKDGLKA